MKRDKFEPRREVVWPEGSVAAKITLPMAILVLLTGCDLDAKNPRAITEPDLQSPEAVTALVNGVIGESDQAYQRTILLSGLLSDELSASGTWSAWIKADRQGTIELDAPAGDGQNIAHDWWLPLQRTRRLAEESYARVQQVIPNPESSALTALTRLYSGMAYRDLGEFFCQAAYDGGAAVDREESLEIAAAHLTESILVAQAAGADSIANMARLSRARVYLSMGRTSDALSDARSVPAGFRWMARYREAPKEFNSAWVVINQLAQATVSEDLAGVDDPRVQVAANGYGPDKITRRFDQQKFGKTGDVARGKWQEARLIEAEILLSQGQVEAAVGLLNGVRAAAGVAPLSSGLSAEAAEAALQAERRHELFLAGERMLDMRRWGLYPAGWQADCVPMPRSETDNNPNV